MGGIEEPYIKAQVITKTDYVGAVMNLCIEKRGELTNQVYLTQDRGVYISNASIRNSI